MRKSLKDTPYWNIWADCCSIHKRFFGIREDDTAAWEAVLQEAKAIRSKYKNSDSGKFAESMVLLVVSELENKSKNQKGGSTDATKKQTEHTAEQP